MNGISHWNCVKTPEFGAFFSKPFFSKFLIGKIEINASFPGLLQGGEVYLLRSVPGTQKLTPVFETCSSLVVNSIVLLGMTIHKLLAECMCTTYLTFLYLSFLICKIESITVTIWWGLVMRRKWICKCIFLRRVPSPY